MADRLSWVKFLFENRIAIAGIFLSLASFGGFQTWSGSEKSSDINMLKNQITEMAVIMAKPVAHQEGKDWSIYTDKVMNQHRREYH